MGYKLFNLGIKLKLGNISKKPEGIWLVKKLGQDIMPTEIFTKLGKNWIKLTNFENVQG